MDAKYAIDCSKSMHVLKTGLTKSHLAEQSEVLLGGLDRAIAATVECAPVRRDSRYLVDCDETIFAEPDRVRDLPDSTERRCTNEQKTPVRAIVAPPEG